MTAEDLQKIALRIRDIMIAEATGGTHDGYGEYPDLRRALIEDPRTRDHVPPLLRDNRTIEEFWGFIKRQWPTYQERRDQLKDAFAPLLLALEHLVLGAPSDRVTSDVIARLGSAAVQGIWAKALDRRRDDTDGAITAARSLMEATCKHVLDVCGVAYDNGETLPALYRKAATELHLGADQHTADALKQVLGGCASVVHGLAAMRNALGDAHGKGRTSERALPIHAGLAVNLAGSVASFLLQTLELRTRSEG